MELCYTLAGIRYEAPNMSDSELLGLSAHGDEAAFTALYRRHKDAVFRFALHMSGQPHIAEEITQEVFLLLIHRPKQYQPERGTLEAFLIGVARNKLRKQRREQQLPESDVNSAALLHARSHSEAFELELLQSAILTLPARYREVIVLCELEEKTYEETARLLGCAVGTIRSRLHRAKGILGTKVRHKEGCSA